jgi:hypothetical protein
MSSHIPFVSGHAPDNIKLDLDGKAYMEVDDKRIYLTIEMLQCETCLQFAYAGCNPPPHSASRSSISAPNAPHRVQKATWMTIAQSAIENVQGSKRPTE